MLKLLWCAILMACVRADDVFQRAVEKLREAQADPKALVQAVVLLTQAADECERTSDAVRAPEVNAMLYWARKRMTLADIDTLHGKPAEKRVEAVVTPIDSTQASQFLDRAEAYAKTQADPLLQAIRYFEVGDRFKDTDAGRKAIELSLKAMQRIVARPEKVVPVSVTRPAPQPVVVTKPIDKKSIVGRWNGVCPEWIKASIVEFKKDGRFIMLDKRIGGEWDTTEDSLILKWDQYPEDELKRVDDGTYWLITDKGKFSLKRVGFVSPLRRLDLAKIDYEALTAEQWDSVQAATVIVQASAHMDTRIEVASGQLFMLLPHPGDRWRCGENGDVDFKGYAERSGKVFDAGRLIWRIGEIKNRYDARIESPGRLYLQSASDKPDLAGQIRVKILRLK